MDTLLLSQEIKTDPKAIGYAPLVLKGAHNAIADAMNLPRYTVGSSIPRSTLLAWAAQYDVIERLEDASVDKLSPVRSKARGALMLLSLPDPDAATIDMDDTAVSGMFQALIAAGTIPQAAYAAFPSSTKTISRAEELFGERVSVEQVSMALKV